MTKERVSVSCWPEISHYSLQHAITTVPINISKRCGSGIVLARFRDVVANLARQLGHYRLTGLIFGEAMVHDEYTILDVDSVVVAVLYWPT